MPKSTRKPELADALRVVMDGSVFLLPGYKRPSPAEVDAERKALIERLSSLTAEQLRVLHMLRAGLLNKQIAYELSVGERDGRAIVPNV